MAICAATHGSLVRTAALLGVLLLVAGCRTSSPVEVVPVRGVVRLKHQPLANAVVTFIPIHETPGQGGQAVTNSAGEFQVAGHQGEPGLKPGQYRVAVSKLLRADGTEFPFDSPVSPMDADARESIADAYSDPAATQLSADVQSSMPSLELEVTAKK